MRLNFRPHYRHSVVLERNKQQIFLSGYNVLPSSLPELGDADAELRGNRTNFSRAYGLRPREYYRGSRVSCGPAAVARRDVVHRAGVENIRNSISE